MIDIKTLERAFYPRTVAVVGDTRRRDYHFLKALSTFKGKVYSVQIDPEEFAGITSLGIPNYLSLLDIPDVIDYVIVAVPRVITPKILEDCIKKKVGAVAFFTSAFAETGTEEGRIYQEILTKMAKEAGINLIGPNCMGIFNPKIGLRFTVEQYYGESGPVGFISQSGTHLIQLSTLGYLHGIKLSKGVSYGNAIVLDSPDYLDFFVQDEETKVIGLYIEWVRDTRRFFSSLKKATEKKPILVWKGGETEDSQRAAFSHTAALIQSPLLWEAMLKQCGAIKVNNLIEMIDTLKAILYLKPPKGNRMGLIAMSGGQSVAMADAFSKAGLSVPQLSHQSYQELSSFFKIIGGSFKNPFDVSWQLSLGDLKRILGVLDRDENIDCVCVEVSAPFISRRWEAEPSFFEELLEILANFKEKSEKPLLLILSAVHLEGLAIEIRERMNLLGLAHFSTFEQAANSLKRVLDYYKRKEAL